MLEITIPKQELFNEKTLEFIETEECKLRLEHSLISLSKWESKLHKRFLTEEEKTPEETLEYIKCMTLTPNVDPNVYNFLTPENFKEIANYIDDPMTATTFGATSEKNKKRIGGEEISSELIYYWMVALQIPAEYQKWHLNRLITLIKVCNIKNQPEKKMSDRDVANKYRAMKAASRRRKH